MPQAKFFFKAKYEKIKNIKLLFKLLYLKNIIKIFINT